MTSISLLLLAASTATAGEISVIGSLVREASLQAGEKTEGVILVRNNGDVPREVIVHQTDYRFTADGRNDFAEAGTLPRSNTGWIQFSPGQATIPPHATASVYYTMETPQQADLQGTYWSLLMVEALPTVDLDAPVVDARGVRIDTVIRYGIELITEVGAPSAGALAFESGALRRADGQTILALDIGNTGTRQLSPQVWVDVFDAGGASMGRFQAKRRSRLLPGCSARYDLDLTSLPSAQYTGLAIADAGSDQVFGSDYTLDLR